MISLTDRALRVAIGLKKDNETYRELPLRVYIAGKGCDGFYYGVSFDLKSPKDLSFKQDALEIIIDPDSMSFMQNSIIDYVNDERGEGFLIDNPNHKKFRGKFYRKKSWKNSLATKKDEPTSSQ